MTLYEVNTLPYVRQLVAVFDEDTFVTRQRGRGFHQPYHLPSGFFAERYYDTLANEWGGRL